MGHLEGKLEETGQTELVTDEDTPSVLAAFNELNGN